MIARIQHKFAALVAAALSLAAVTAHADSFELDYTFGGALSSSGAGTTVETTFNGTLNGNLITGISNATLTVNGVLLGSVYGYEYGNTGWLNGAAVISLDGTQNDFGFFNTNTPIFQSATVQFSSFTGTATAYTNNYANIVVSIPNFFAFDQSSQSGGDPLNSSYKVTDLTTSSPVPDSSATITMLGLAVAGLVGLRRRLR